MKGHHISLLPILHNEPIIIDNARAEVFNQYFNSVFTTENMGNFSIVNSLVVDLSPMLEIISFPMMLSIKN